MSGYIFVNYHNFKIFFTFFLFWFGIQFGELVEDSVAFFLVLTIGILHGANDILILSKNEKDLRRKIKFLVIYLGIILLAIITYFLSPFLSILIFIGISSYHFGEEHLSEKISINLLFNSVFYFLYGLTIFLLLFLSSINEVNDILTELVGKTFNFQLLKYALILSILLLLTGSLFIYYKNKEKSKFLLLELFYIFLLFLIFKTNTLIYGFAIYFIFWHSLPSILNQIYYLSENFSRESIFSYVKKAFVYWLASILSLLILFKYNSNLDLFSTVLFVLLFAVTAPHIWVMFRMKN